MHLKRNILTVQLLVTYLIVVLHSGMAHCHALPHDEFPLHTTHDHGSDGHHGHDHDQAGILHFFEHLFEGISHMHAMADHPVVIALKSKTTTAFKVDLITGPSSALFTDTSVAKGACYLLAGQDSIFVFLNTAHLTGQPLRGPPRSV